MVAAFVTIAVAVIGINGNISKNINVKRKITFVKRKGFKLLCKSPNL